jgi:hypothetical protein
VSAKERCLTGGGSAGHGHESAWLNDDARDCDLSLRSFAPLKQVSDAASQDYRAAPGIVNQIKQEVQGKGLGNKRSHTNLQSVRRRYRQGEPMVHDAGHLELEVQLRALIEQNLDSRLGN